VSMVGVGEGRTYDVSKDKRHLTGINEEGRLD